MTVELLHIDCMEYMATLEDNAFDLAITDPPYGIGEDASHNDSGNRPTDKWKNPNIKRYKTFDDSSAPDPKYFTELFRVSKNQIIWGANNFTGNIPPSGGWIVWDKKADIKEHLSMCELAYSSFKKRCLKFEFLWAGFKKAEPEQRIHPTQKPIALYKWLLKNYAKEGQRVLDTHLGSGSSAIAAHYFGVDFVGCELDADYYKAACERFDRETRQIDMFGTKP
jgi:site-specific DNA-methyltransferase (adenine-specific)